MWDEKRKKRKKRGDDRVLFMCSRFKEGATVQGRSGYGPNVSRRKEQRISHSKEIGTEVLI